MMIRFVNIFHKELSEHLTQTQNKLLESVAVSLKDSNIVGIMRDMKDQIMTDLRIMRKLTIILENVEETYISYINRYTLNQTHNNTGHVHHICIINLPSIYNIFSIQQK